MAEEPDFDWEGTLARVREGDREAGRRLVEVLYPQIARVVYARLGRGVDAEDRMQDIFVKMFSRLHQFRGERPFPHWVMRIAVTTCIDHLRRKQRRPESRFADLDPEEWKTAEGGLVTVDSDQTQASDDLQLARQLLAMLKPEDQQLMEWLEIEGKTLAEIASMTGHTVLRLKLRAFRARRRLQEEYRRLMKRGRT